VGLILLAACTARPTQDVSELPPPQVSAPQMSASQAPASQVGPGAPMPSRPTDTVSTRISPAPEPRIEELYAGAGRRVRSSGLPSGQASGDITLNFENADVREVVRVIVGDLLGANYVIDPNVTGALTLATNEPISRAALLPTLDAALAGIGARVANEGGVYRVTRTGVREGGGGIGVAPADEGRAASYLVFPLEYVSASEMQTVLESVLPQGAVSYTDADRNLLIVSGDAGDLRLASQTIDIFDVDAMAGRHVLLVGLQNADAQAVVKEVQSIFGASGRTPASRQVTEFIAVDRLNAIMVLSRNMEHVEQARDWIYRLDRSRDPTERRLFVYYVQHGQAENLATALRDIVTTVGNDGGSAGARLAATRQAQSQSSGDGAATEVAEAPQAIQTNGLTIAVDAERNALLISATAARFRIVEDVLAKLDIPPLQVMIEASIFEVALRDTLRYGIQYAASNGGLGFSDEGLASLSRGTATASGVGSIIRPVITPFLPGFNFTLEGSSDTRLIIDALSDLSEVNMISSPNIIVLNNKVAQLRVGDEVPIVTQTTTSAVTDNPLIVNTVQYRSTGVNLEVTPRVNASGMVTLDIIQEVSDVTTTTSSNIDSPTIQNRSLLSTVTIESGETIMLGGLIRERAEDGKSGIPVLHELPVIGALFGGTSRFSQRTELVVLIRPVIVENPEDARVLTGNLKQKFITLMQRERVGIRQPRRILKEDAL
ncbi:MAG: type II secretion system secretin GspD, partial [Acetobacterales bacterium]